MAQWTQNDTNFTVTFNVKDYNREVVSLADITTIKFQMKQRGASSLKIDGSCTVLNATRGICTYTIAVGDLDTVGKYDAGLQITFDDGEIITGEMEDIFINSELD